MSLEELRVEIDKLDQELVRLMDRRAEIAMEVGKSKANTGMLTFDPGRAKAVILQAVARSNGAFPREGLVYVFREVLSACLNLQKPLRVGYMGPSETFSHQAAIREFGSSVHFLACESIPEVFAAVEKNRIDYGVVPVENSAGGMVHKTLDAFIDNPAVSICSEILLPVRHSLLSATAIANVRRIYSHPQAFLQCAQWLRDNLPNAELREVSSTAQGILEAKNDENSAAIASEHAADKYSLRVLASGIEDSQDNTTRFLVIALQDSRPCGDDKTSLMFGVKDTPGSLISVLKPFSDLTINMSKIESRPTRKRAWEQAFFVDVQVHRTDQRFEEVLNLIRPSCESLRILGSYPREKTPREIEEIQKAGAV